MADEYQSSALLVEDLLKDSVFEEDSQPAGPVEPSPVSHHVSSPSLCMYGVASSGSQYPDASYAQLIPPSSPSSSRRSGEQLHWQADSYWESVSVPAHTETMSTSLQYPDDTAAYGAYIYSDAMPGSSVVHVIPPTRQSRAIQASAQQQPPRVSAPFDVPQAELSAGRLLYPHIPIAPAQSSMINFYPSRSSGLAPALSESTEVKGVSLKSRRSSDQGTIVESGSPAQTHDGSITAAGSPPRAPSPLPYTPSASQPGYTSPIPLPADPIISPALARYLSPTAPLSGFRTTPPLNAPGSRGFSPQSLQRTPSPSSLSPELRSAASASISPVAFAAPAPHHTASTSPVVPVSVTRPSSSHQSVNLLPSPYPCAPLSGAMPREMPEGRPPLRLSLPSVSVSPRVSMKRRVESSSSENLRVEPQVEGARPFKRPRYVVSLSTPAPTTSGGAELQWQPATFNCARQPSKSLYLGAQSSQTPISSGPSFTVGAGAGHIVSTAKNSVSPLSSGSEMEPESDTIDGDYRQKTEKSVDGLSKRKGRSQGRSAKWDPDTTTLMDFITSAIEKSTEKGGMHGYIRGRKTYMNSRRCRLCRDEKAQENMSRHVWTDRAALIKAFIQRDLPKAEVVHPRDMIILFYFLIQFLENREPSERWDSSGGEAPADFRAERDAFVARFTKIPLTSDAFLTTFDAEAEYPLLHAQLTKHQMNLALRCRYCNELFARPDLVPRHEREVCPGISESELLAAHESSHAHVRKPGKASEVAALKRKLESKKRQPSSDPEVVTPQQKRRRKASRKDDDLEDWFSA